MLHDQVLEDDAKLISPYCSIRIQTAFAGSRASKQDLSPKSQCANLFVFQTTTDILGMPDADNSWAGVSHLVNISEYYLRESQGQLEIRDVPSLLGMLSRVAELPTTGGQSHAKAHTLSRSIINLADTLMSEEIMDKWETIREVKPWTCTLLKSTAIDTMIAWRVST